MQVDISQPVTQEAFGLLVGISQPKVSQLLTDGVLERGAPLARWLLTYCERLREQAAGRLGDSAGTLDLPQERAALARSQRIGQDIRNAVARKEYAPIGLLADVLGAASAGLVDRFDQLEAALAKAAPELGDAGRQAIQQVVASARNEWIRSTQSLVVARLDELVDIEDEDSPDTGDDAA